MSPVIVRSGIPANSDESMPHANRWAPVESMLRSSISCVARVSLANSEAPSSSSNDSLTGASLDRKEPQLNCTAPLPECEPCSDKVSTTGSEQSTLPPKSQVSQHPVCTQR